MRPVAWHLNTRLGKNRLDGAGPGGDGAVTAAGCPAGDTPLLSVVRGAAPGSC